MANQVLNRRTMLIVTLAGLLTAGRRAQAADEGAEIAREVIEIFARRLEVDPDVLRPEHRFLEDLGLDDILEIGEILTDIEARMDVDIPVDIATQFETIGNVIQFMKDVRASRRF